MSEFVANHYLALPAIETSPPSIRNVNVLHAGLGGLVEWSAADDGPGLITPVVAVAGSQLDLSGAEWDLVDRWLPRFSATTPDLAVTGTICPLPGHDARARVVMWILDFANRGGERTIDVGFTGVWRWSRLRIASGRPLLGTNRLVRGPGDGLVLESGSDGNGVALALLLLGRDIEHAAGDNDANMRALAAGHEIVEPNGDPIHYALRRSLRMRAGGRNRCVLVIAAGAERDGALGAAASASMWGAEAALREMRLELARVSRTGEGREAEIVARNFLHAHFCGVARAVDDDRLYPIRSRSPLHHAPGTVDEREALAWLLPLLIITDRFLARELIERVMEQYSDRPGNPVRYVSGGVLWPGFALDAACALVLGIDRYVKETGDATLLDEPLAQTVLHEIDDLLWSRLHPDIFLASTELLPSGDRPDHPWVAWSNVQVWAAIGAIERCWRNEPPPLTGGRAEELAAAFWQRLTTDYDGVRVIACSTDLSSEAAVYDDPRGSLAWLPALGFCDADDPIWENTLELLRSRDYPFWLGDRPHPGLAGRGAPGEASLVALCADLSTSRREYALGVLRSLNLPSGIAAEFWNPDTGEAVRGHYAAGVAALLALSLRATPPAGRA